MLANTMAFYDMVSDLKASLLGSLAKEFGELLVMALLDVTALAANEKLGAVISMAQQATGNIAVGRLDFVYKALGKKKVQRSVDRRRFGLWFAFSQQIQ